MALRLVWPNSEAMAHRREFKDAMRQRIGVKFERRLTQAVIRALAKFYYRSHSVFAKTRPDYQPSHEIQSRYRGAIYGGAASLANPHSLSSSAGGPSTWWNATKTFATTCRMIPSQFIQDRRGVYDQREGGRREDLAVLWIRSSDGVYRPAPMACASPAAVVMVACRGKTFSSSTRCTSSSPSEQQSPTTSSL